MFYNTKTGISLERTKLRYSKKQNITLPRFGGAFREAGFSFSSDRQLKGAGTSTMNVSG